MRIVIAVGEALARRAKPLYLQLVPQNPVVHGPSGFFLETDVHGHRQVVDPPAAQAADVIVPAGIAVEPGGMASGMDLADDTLLGELLQVPVDRPEADARDLAARLSIDPVRGGMVHGGPHHLEDQLALPRLPATHSSNDSYLAGEV